MKITKARLKQIIVEELEAVMSEEEEEETTTESTETEEEPLSEFYAGGKVGPSHRDRPSYQKATVGGRVAARSAGTPTLDAAADALGMSPSEMMMALAQEMGVDIASSEEDAPLPVPEGE